MAYIGNKLADAYTSFAKQDFTTSATTSYTLDNPVTNENEIALFINFVRQEPTTAYTASGTSLTLTSATSASDDMYCVFLGKAVQTVNPPAGSVGTSQLEDGSVTSAKLASGVLPTNTPAFQAKFGDSTTQSLSSSVDTKVQYNEEVFDTDNCYDNSTNYRFTPGVSGKYFIYASVRNTTATDLDIYRISIRKNGTQIQTYMDVTRRQESVSISAIVDSNATDYFEIYCVINDAVSLGNENGNNGDANYFGAYKIIE